ncbi:TatD family hydrolase [Candidatus Falkowbacteria bacterium]|nr:TatD family hydrolase [Candidatus Falkowbacteria bacterium]
MLIDTHAHINFGVFAHNLDEVIKRSLENNTYVINVGSNYETSQKAIEIAEKFNGVWAVIGCHPEHLVEDIEEKVIFEGEEKILKMKKEIFDYNKYLALAKSSPKVIGIGETGLDFFYLKPKKRDVEKAKELEINVFKQFIQLAKEVNLPLVLHCRGEEEKNYEAYDLMLDIVGKWQKANGKLTGVIHCFGGNLEQAKKFIDLGFYIGFTGIVTFKNAKELQNIAKEIPLDKILIETDSPYLAPVPFRGKINEPQYVRFVAEKIAELKNINYEAVEEQTFKNAKALFQI